MIKCYQVWSLIKAPVKHTFHHVGKFVAVHHVAAPIAIVSVVCVTVVGPKLFRQLEQPVPHIVQPVDLPPVPKEQYGPPVPWGSAFWYPEPYNHFSPYIQGSMIGGDVMPINPGISEEEWSQINTPCCSGTPEIPTLPSTPNLPKLPTHVDEPSSLFIFGGVLLMLGAILSLRRKP